VGLVFAIGNLETWNESLPSGDVRRFSRFVSTKERWAQNHCSIHVHIYMISRDKLADIQYTFNATSLGFAASSFELVDARPPNLAVRTPFVCCVCWQTKFTVKHFAGFALANLAAKLPQNHSLGPLTCLGWDGYIERHCRRFPPVSWHTFQTGHPA
jgi:hypothetical protein